MGWVGLGVNLSGLGLAGFKKMDPRPTLHKQQMDYSEGQIVIVIVKTEITARNITVFLSPVAVLNITGHCCNVANVEAHLYNAV